MSESGSSGKPFAERSEHDPAGEALTGPLTARASAQDAPRRCRTHCAPNKKKRAPPMKPSSLRGWGRELTWKQGDPPTDLGSSNQVCVLSGVSGRFDGQGEHVHIAGGDTSRWVLEGSSGQDDEGIRCRVYHRNGRRISWRSRVHSDGPELHHVEHSMRCTSARVRVEASLPRAEGSPSATFVRPRFPAWPAARADSAERGIRGAEWKLR